MKKKIIKKKYLTPRMSLLGSVKKNTKGKPQKNSWGTDSIGERTNWGSYP